MHINLVLCATGSVAGIKVGDLIQLLSQNDITVRVAVSEHGALFCEQHPRVEADKLIRDHNDYGLGPSDLKEICVDESEIDTVNTRALLDQGSHPNSISDPMHIQLACWADVLLFAPLSANSLSKLSLGLCDNLVSRVYRSWNMAKPVLLCPAMNTKMWEHPVTKTHIESLQHVGCLIVSPVSKTLACGDVGIGAMAPVSAIVEAVLECVQERQV